MRTQKTARCFHGAVAKFDEQLAWGAERDSDVESAEATQTVAEASHVDPKESPRSVLHGILWGSRFLKRTFKFQSSCLDFNDLIKESEQDLGYS